MVAAKALLAALGALGAGPVAGVDPLNDYLKDKVFGSIGNDGIGPCSFYFPCEGDIAADLPPQIAATPVKIFNFLPETTLGELLESGTYKIEKLLCDNVSVETFKMDHAKQEDQDRIRADLSVSGGRVRCSFIGTFVDVKLLPFNGAEGWSSTFTLDEQQFTFEQTLSDPGTSLDVPVLLKWDLEDGQTMDTEMPSTIAFVEGECDILPNFGLTAELEDDRFDYIEFCSPAFCLRSTNILWNIVFNWIDWGEFLDGLFSVIEGIVGAIMCAVLEQTAKTVIVDGEEKTGFLLALVEELAQTVNEWAESQGDDVRAEDQDAALLARFPQLAEKPMEDTVLFSQSRAAELVSIALNEYLGKITDSGTLLVNELVERLTEPDGFLSTGDISGEQFGFMNDGGIADLSMFVNQIDVQNLNTATTFKVLKNGYDDESFTPYRRTFNNELAYEKIGLDLVTTVHLDRGYWVTGSCNLPSNQDDACESDSVVFDVTFSVTLEDVRVAFASNAVFNDAELDSLTLGQFDQLRSYDSWGEMWYRFKQCTSAAFYSVFFPSVEVSVGTITDPVIKSFESDQLRGLMQDSIELFADAAKGALSAKMPNITQGPVRSYFNRIAMESYVAIGEEFGVEECRKREEPPQQLWRVRFDEQPANAIFALINDGFGGNPVQDTESDINEAIDAGLKFYEVAVPSLPLDSWDNTTEPPQRFPQGYWELKDSYQDAAVIYAVNDDGSSLGFTNFSVNNLNSLHKLEASYFPGAAPGVQVVAGFGGAMADPQGAPLPAKPIELKMTFSVDTAPERGSLAEEWDMVLRLAELEFDFALSDLQVELSDVFNLRVPQIWHAPCVLQSLVRVLFPSANRRASVLDLDFSVSQVSGLPANSGVRIVDALHGLSDAQLPISGGDPDDPVIKARLRTERRFKALLNTVAEGSLDYALNALERIPETYRGVGPKDCLDRVDPLEGIDLVAPIFPNATGFREECLAPLNKDDRLSPQEAEDTFVVGYNSDDDLVFDFQTSSIIGVVRDLANSGDTLERILFDLANSTSTNLLSGYFSLGENKADGELQVNLEIPLAELGYYLENSVVAPGVTLDAGVMRVEGFDRLVRNSYSLFRDVSTMTLRHELNFDDVTPLDIVITTVVTVLPEAVGEKGDDPIVETIDSALEVRGLSVALDTILAIDAERFGNLSLGSLFTVGEDQSISVAEHGVNCFLSSVFEGGIYIPYMDVEVTNMTGPVVKSRGNELLSPAIEEFVAAALEIVQDFYLDGLPNICDNCLRKSLNENISARWAAAQKPGACPAIEDVALPAFEDDNVFYRFNEAPDFVALQSSIAKYLAGDDLATFNAFVSSATKPLLFEYVKDNAVGASGIPIIYGGEQFGTVDIQVADMQLAGMNTFTYLDFLQPWYDEFELASSGKDSANGVIVNANEYDGVSLEEIPYMTRTRFKIAGEASINAKYDFNATELFPELPNMVNQLGLNLLFTELELGLDLFLKVNITEALEMRFDSISGLSRAPCALVPVEELIFKKFNMTTETLTSELECLGSCDLFKGFGLEKGSPVPAGNADKLSELTNSFVRWFAAYLDTQGAQDSIASFLLTAPEQCDRLLGIIEDSLQVPDNDSDVVWIFFAYGFAGLLGMAGFGALLLFPVHKKRRQVIMARVLGRHQEEEDDKAVAAAMAMVELSMRSIFQHPMTPRVAKFLVPLVCIANIVGLVVAIGFSGAASVVISATALGSETQVVPLVPFTVLSTVNDTWNSGSWPLAVLIAVASCAWPVFKNLMLLGLWFTPATVVRAKSRRWWLETLDMLGKWSFLDVYVVVLMLAALSTYVSASYSSYLAFLDPEFAAVTVSVTPEAGIILLCFVAASSLIINHVIIVMHDRVQRSNNTSEDKLSGNYREGQAPQRAVVKRRVMQHAYVGTDARGRARSMSKRAGTVLIALTGLALVLVLAGLSVPAITFEVRGLVGLLLREIEANPTAGLTADLATKTYSVFTLGSTVGIPNATFGQQVALLFFKMLYFVCVLGGPVMALSSALALFILPLNLPNLRSLLFWTKIASYWSAIEVLLAALVATVFGITAVSKFIVDFITDGLCSYIEAAIAVAVPDPEDASCLEIFGYFEPTIFLLCAGVLLQLICYYIITVLARSVIDDRYFAAYRELRNDVRPKRLGRLAKLTIRLFTTTSAAGSVGDESSSPAATPSSFFNLDGDPSDAENEHVDLEESCCARMSNWCCSADHGEALADKRIQAWQSKFGVDSPHLEHVSPNPAFESRRSFDSFSSAGRGPPPSPLNGPQRFSQLSDDVEV